MWKQNGKNTFTKLHTSNKLKANRHGYHFYSSLYPLQQQVLKAGRCCTVAENQKAFSCAKSSPTDCRRPRQQPKGLRETRTSKRHTSLHHTHTRIYNNDRSDIQVVGWRKSMGLSDTREMCLSIDAISDRGQVRRRGPVVVVRPPRLMSNQRAQPTG